jgi:undecaprenyl-diphosphatase
MTGWILRIGTFDRWLLWALARGRRPYLTAFMKGVTRVGDPVPAIGTAALLFSGLLPGPEGVGRDAAFALALSHGVSQVLKRWISRSRPRLPVGFGSLIDPPDRFSFPSGHASATLSLALPLYLALPAFIGAPILGLAIIIGLSRCYLGVHYPGDVVVGWGIAALSVVLVS